MNDYPEYVYHRVKYACGHISDPMPFHNDSDGGQAYAEMQEQPCPDCYEHGWGGWGFYVICGYEGNLYVIPAAELWHCRIEQIVDGPYSSAAAAHARMGGVQVEHMLGETGMPTYDAEGRCSWCGRFSQDCTC